MPSEYTGSVYMDGKILSFVRTWPDVPEVLMPIWHRLYMAGVLVCDEDPPHPPPREWPRDLRLSAVGLVLRDLAKSQTFNFFQHADATRIGAALNPAYAAPFQALWKDPIDLPPANPNRLTGLKASLGRLGVAMDRMKESLK